MVDLGCGNRGLDVLVTKVGEHHSPRINNHAVPVAGALFVVPPNLVDVLAPDRIGLLVVGKRV